MAGGGSYGGGGGTYTETAEYNEHTVTWNYTLSRAARDVGRDSPYERTDEYVGVMRFVPLDGGPMFQVHATGKMSWTAQYSEMEDSNPGYEFPFEYDEDPNKSLTKTQREWMKLFERESFEEYISNHNESG